MNERDINKIRPHIVGGEITGMSEYEGGRFTVWIRGHGNAILELIVSEPVLAD
tara:strand:+ start:274 stop:432 length:159 start_codon:yes stop_codon:yes gene_type:complete